MVGYNENIAAKLEHAPGLDLYCLEEPDLMTSACVARGALREIRPGAYQQSTACVAQAIDWHREIGFEGVMPCREYAVGAAHAVAEALGLRSLGERATRAFTHKAALREACAASGVLQPAHARATSAQDVAAFVRRFGPSVLKPANRQSSVGVVALASPEDAEAAWRYTTAQGEGNRVVNSRELRWDYVIEAKVEGPMFSVESLLLDGRALFENVTRKILDPSIFAVEMGHIVPCPDSPGGQETAALLEAQRLLREAVDAGTGVLHSEWIMTAQGPYLVECAGRAPGGFIPELISMTIGQEFYALYAQALCGRPVCALGPQGYAVIAHFGGNPGRVRTVKGLDAIASREGFVRAKLNYAEGDIVPPLLSNWDRRGYAILRAESADDALRFAEAARMLEPYDIAAEGSTHV
ncbi:ATP-grasp domain-containing protein [Xanthomonas oryzae]|uniref:ATP-grasp domain-containing protein n=1 Tax=Xanthomonas oryzae TaxID=347 RepID=UPI0010351B4E|nr:ATP-grasp domain-containing protein [Xanthomonas oryzae]QBG95732.1 ATP-grasp domain-containing protein [Xanthomonas oryzae]